ncbi:E3 ubiquitin-protein ligase LRSAM1-like [Lineus longissimus]|uniref:E3 ubiquitin-protein ligase LRSAM1-like n=1 Tax=Lineus longissimus TaxID=88925 RepID=UPI002B4F25CE
MGSSPSVDSGSRDRSEVPVAKAESSTSGIMPLLKKKQSAQAKKKQEHQLYLAREAPDSNFDLSGCEISDVPSGVFSLCRVLQKEVLLLNNNWLTSLKGGGNLKDLAFIRILDLHDNEFVTLPDDIGQLVHLQVLNVEGNKLKQLPSNIGHLTSLQTINVRRNKIKELPSSMSSLASLRTLEISDNLIAKLPRNLCEVKTLENLALSYDSMIYPSRDVCKQGTEAIMRFLCVESGVAYTPPSKVLLNVLDVPTVMKTSISNHSLRAIEKENNVLQESLMLHEQKQAKKKKDMIALEKQMEEDQRQQAELAAMSSQKKMQLVNDIATLQDQLDNEINILHQRKDAERKVMVANLSDVEKTASQLIEALLAMNEKAMKREELLEKMERERIEAEELFIVRQEESHNLRKEDVLAAMKNILAESEDLESHRLQYQASRDLAAKRASEGMTEVDGNLEFILMGKDCNRDELINQLLLEERLQREAFECLQMQKDAKHQRITHQIEIIQEELSQLTVVEIERREVKLDTEKNILAEKRKALTDLMLALMDQRMDREKELRKRMGEMEQQRLDDQHDYWLIQYQRLMDKKPQSLMDLETNLEIEVVKILERSGAHDYLQNFARHRITIETLCQMTEEDLRHVGVQEVGTRKSILRHVDEFIAHDKIGGKKTKQKEEPPPAASAAPAKMASAPSVQEITTRITSECVVCMDEESTVVFLNCGHVCTCNQCSLTVNDCPLCRQVISHRIKLAPA